MKKIPTSKKGSQSEERFIQGKSNFPWADANERVIKSFNLRLPEPMHMKLQFIAENTPHSIHSFIMNVVSEAVDREIERLTN
jgi:predicted HicB family RNase H-like nuclease